MNGDGALHPDDISVHSLRSAAALGAAAGHRAECIGCIGGPSATVVGRPGSATPQLAGPRGPVGAGSEGAAAASGDAVPRPATANSKCHDAPNARRNSLLEAVQAAGDAAHGAAGARAAPAAEARVLFRVAFRPRIGLRSEPASTAALVGFVDHGETLEIAEVQGGWARLCGEEKVRRGVGPDVPEAWARVSVRGLGLGVDRLLERVTAQSDRRDEAGHRPPPEGPGDSGGQDARRTWRRVLNVVRAAQVWRREGESRSLEATGQRTPVDLERQPQPGPERSRSLEATRQPAQERQPDVARRSLSAPPGGLESECASQASQGNLSKLASSLSKSSSASYFPSWPTRGLSTLSSTLNRAASDSYFPQWSARRHRPGLGDQGLLGRDISLQRPVETFMCPICAENAPLDQRVVLDACGDLDHGICKECALGYFRGRVGEMRVDAIPCPIGLARGGCRGQDQPGVASEVEVERVLEAEAGAVERFRRFRRMRANGNLRECPDCGELCSPQLAADGKIQAEMHCHACSSTFCYYHSGAHKEDGDCAAYEARLVRESQEFAKIMGMKNCPGCTRQTEKNGGCNHMTCQQCGCHWCWICGNRIAGGASGVGWHYDPDNPDSGCLQFSPPGGHPPADRVRAMRNIQQGRGTSRRERCWSYMFPVTKWWLRIMFFVLSAPVVITSGVLLAACGCACCCCICATAVYGLGDGWNRWLEKKNLTTDKFMEYYFVSSFVVSAVVWALLVVLPTFIVWTIVSFVVWVSMRCPSGMLCQMVLSFTDAIEGAFAFLID